MSAPKLTLDRFAQIGDLAAAVRQILSRWLPLAAAVLGIELGILFLSGHHGTKAFALIAAGGLLVLNVWRTRGEGLPIVPMLALQSVIAFGLPIVRTNETIMGFSEDEMTAAGREVFFYSLCLLAGWTLGNRFFVKSSATCYALQGFDEARFGRLARLGFRLLYGSTAFIILRSLELLDPLLSQLPSGSLSIVNVLVATVGSCGYFLAAMLVGKAGCPPAQRAVFWVLFTLQCLISASAFLLSSTIMLVFSVMIGLFWGGGRIPWRYILVVLSVVSFFNLGKFTMRERYWRTDTGEQIVPSFPLADMPAIYVEWFEASVAGFGGSPEPADRFLAASERKSKGQSLGDRINNLQNLLYVIDVMENKHVPPLHGATYLVIPPLLLPRVIWPDKPRSHEGQIMLNVHFGRQDLVSTHKTYVAWGLLPEAYGNFGPLAGAIVLGLCLGLFCSWVERLTARKLLLSMEGFLGFTLFLGMANSFEMVASVLVTSIFQALVPVVLASKPFTERITPRRPTPPAAAAPV
ncbi:MAG: hypothetical protein HZA93_25495 [Verrucomicrobia bacterium]|nr:hypothetical protein [Verrucomicrobiota bacterium]